MTEAAHFISSSSECGRHGSVDIDSMNLNSSTCSIYLLIYHFSQLATMTFAMLNALLSLTRFNAIVFSDS